MIEIRCSDGNEGIDLSGSPAELRDIQQLIVELVKSE
jgi:hypothetical protein